MCEKTGLYHAVDKTVQEESSENAGPNVMGGKCKN